MRENRPETCSRATPGSNFSPDRALADNLPIAIITTKTNKQKTMKRKKIPENLDRVP